MELLLNNKINVKDLPLCDRPYERFIKYGAEKLSDSELLAIVIRNGTKTSSALNIANVILKDGGLTNLVKHSFETLKSFDGIGEIKAIQLKCICELFVRLGKSERAGSISFSSAEEIANYARRTMKFKTYEVLTVYYLNNKLRLLCEEEFSSNENSVEVPIKKIIRKALLINSTRIILVHNHPSNYLRPSKDDIKTTKKLKELLNNVDVMLDDHIIVTDNDYYSMRFNKDM